MTTCELIMKPIQRMVEEEKKNLDEIAESVCPKVEYGREKIIRIIKDFLGEEYLVQHAETLNYSVKMAEMAKKRKPKTQEKIDAKDKSHEKIPTKADSEPKENSCKANKPEKTIASKKYSLESSNLENKIKDD